MGTKPFANEPVVSHSPYKARPADVITSGIKVIEGPKDIRSADAARQN